MAVQYEFRGKSLGAAVQAAVGAPRRKHDPALCAEYEAHIAETQSEIEAMLPDIEASIDQLTALLEKLLAEINAEHGAQEREAEELDALLDEVTAHSRWDAAEALWEVGQQVVGLIASVTGIGAAFRAFRVSGNVGALANAAGIGAAEFLNVFFGWDDFVAGVSDISEYIQLSSLISQVENGKAYVEWRLNRLDDLRDLYRQSCGDSTSDHG
ncbi:hypothetical protein K3X48_11370 [Aliiroseovarius crassostreae]|uniref:Uncharacterized protein n=1 Tax=Aliiroseovarius crassostreae TaxID=154981 RepID=A0A9Q9HCF4_9RHOB|nr:hypothetical protein [Aliiroseovarius crassostreae]UWP94805.1 hypothetical protein K3X48_11370 [Aliiroseovarius crassostreae]